ncbi:TPA: glutamate racemase [Candidatus Sumerlaeota bacterium]|jgi:glutamate racemase|nr:glutamate racemase [Candidatus Sumerlaeota bacterium]
MCSPNNNPIGIFDSGLGGLTVARAIRNAFPNEAICYLGDTARVPYGSKSPDTVKRYAREDIAFLLSRNVKVIVAACNTVSAAALPELINCYPVPVLGVVEIGAETALEDAPKKIGIIGTETTVRSQAYVRAILKRSPETEVVQKACPLLVPLIEEGWFEHDVTRMVIEEYLAPMRDSGVNSLILGCTHYPLIRPMLQDFFGPSVRTVDSADAMVHALNTAFNSNQIGRANTNNSAASLYYVTDRGTHFSKLLAAFMGENDLPVEQIRCDELTLALEKREAESKK